MVATVVLGPASAHAANYCVDAEPSCSGTDVTFAQAIDALDDAPDADTIVLGARVEPYVLAARLTVGDDLTITGEGSNKTRIQTVGGVESTGIRVASGNELSLNRLTLDSEVTAYGILADTGATFLGLDDVVINIGADAGVGLEARGANVTALNLVVNGNLDASPCFNDGFHAGLPSAATEIVIKDSEFNTCSGVRVYGEAGTVDVRRTNFEYGDTGFMVSADHENATDWIHVYISSSLFHNPGHPTGSSTGTYAVRTYVDPSVAAEAAAIYADLLNVSIITPSSGRAGIQDHGVVNQAQANCGAGEEATILTTVRSSIFHGAFTGAFAVADFPGSVVCNTSTLDIQRSSVDGTRDEPSTLVQPFGNNTFEADPGFVDPTASDFHLSANSPLVDFIGSPPAFGAFESTTDLDGNARRSLDGASGPLVPLDLGAYEYNAAAPTASINALPASVQTGSVASVSATVADANAGEAASISYAWSLPGGAASTASAPSFTAPAVAGSYPIALTVTDVTGRTGVAVVATLVVVAPPVVTPPIVVTPPTPDTTAPKATFGKLSAKLSTLLAGKVATKFVVKLDEAATVKSILQVKVTTTKLVKKKPVKVTRVVTVGSATLAGKVGTNALSFKLTKAQQKLLAKTLKTKQAKFAYQLATTTVDTAKNAGVTKTAVVVKK